MNRLRKSIYSVFNRNIYINRNSFRSSSYLSLAIINAKIWNPQPYSSSNGAGKIEPMSAIGVSNDRIVCMHNKSEEVLKKCGPDTCILDVKGLLLVPGFIDAHCHFLDGGLRLLSVKLKDAKSKAEFSQRVKLFIESAPPGSWILGGDWDHYSFGGELPTKEWIDDISPHNPVWLNRMDGHMSLANSYALQMAGLSAQTEDVEGGTIVRDGCGNLTGILKDNAMNLVTRHIPKHSEAHQRAALEAAMAYVARQGVTKVHTMVTVDCACGLWCVSYRRDECSLMCVCTCMCVGPGTWGWTRTGRTWRRPSRSCACTRPRTATAA